MRFKIFGKEGAPVLMLIPGLGVSYEIFLPLIEILRNNFHIVAVEVDGFTLGSHTEFTSVDNQAIQVSEYIQSHHSGMISCAYGISLGGKILSRVLERNEIIIKHSILDAAPLLPLPKCLVGPLMYLQAGNVWSCCHWPNLWKWVFHSHYFDVLLDECRKVYPYGGIQAVLDGYRSVYTNKLESIPNSDIHYWYGTKEAFAGKPQVKHLKTLSMNIKVEIFDKMNHGQLLIDHPDQIAKRIIGMQYE